MSEKKKATTGNVGSPSAVTLKDPLFAAVLSWLCPGSGQLYQGRTAKGLLFMVCVLGTFFFGLLLGEGRVVYAAWRPEYKRFAYLCQIGVGLPSLPALVQSHRVRSGKPPLGPYMAPPVFRSEFGEFPNRERIDSVHKRLHRYFELGTIYTMIAGLLNVLVIFDAFGGPAIRTDDQPGGVGGGNSKSSGEGSK